jgi:hypothetical protein
MVERTIFDLLSTSAGSKRIRRVLAGQAVNPWLTELILGFENASASADVYAIAPYFGVIVSDTKTRDAFVAAGLDGVFSWLQSGKNPDLGHLNLPGITKLIAEQVQVVKKHNVPLTTYEGGQHFVGTGGFVDDAAVNDLMDAVNRDPRMKAIYVSYLENWLGQTGSIFHHFVNTDTWSKWGRWGSRENWSQTRETSPKYDGLMTFIEDHPLTNVP